MEAIIKELFETLTWYAKEKHIDKVKTGQGTLYMANEHGDRAKVILEKYNQVKSDLTLMNTMDPFTQDAMKVYETLPEDKKWAVRLFIRFLETDKNEMLKKMRENIDKITEETQEKVPVESKKQRGRRRTKAPFYDEEGRAEDITKQTEEEMEDDVA